MSDTSTNNDRTTAKVARRQDRAAKRAQVAAKSRGLDRTVERGEAHWDKVQERRSDGSLKSTKVRGSAEKLLTRSLSGVIYAVVTIVCVFAGVIPTTLLIVAEAWLCCSEFFRISRMGGRMPNETIGLLAAILFPVAAWVKGLVALSLVIFFLLIVCSVWFVFTPQASIGDVAVTVFGPLYTSLTFSSLVLIRQFDPGLPGAILCFGVMLSIWAYDALAYVFGSTFGVHKLVPRISPNKSVEGFLGGFVASIVVWVVLKVLVMPDAGWIFTIVSSLLVGLASVVGDLFESRIKRGVGVKDSGNLIPGHGGLLDRSDSMFFGVLAAFFLLNFGGVL